MGMEFCFFFFFFFRSMELLFFNSALVGVGLYGMDAFSVSMATVAHDPQMSRRRGVQIAGTFAIFRAVMPMTGSGSRAAGFRHAQIVATVHPVDRPHPAGLHRR